MGVLAHPGPPDPLIRHARRNIVVRIIDRWPTTAEILTAYQRIELQDQGCPPEVRDLGRTLQRWLDQIVAWNTARDTNGSTEAISNLI